MVDMPASLGELKEGEFMVKEKSGGQEVNIFNTGFEEMNFNVLNPF